ncbi:MAG: EAL domain-containing protein [Campylobacterota bacterium]|nr:EAL domain-containing protein [Campylobacterota bacterium]
MDLELLKTLTILYVEDEKDLQEEVFQNLAPFVKKIFRANDGLQGLELFKEIQNDIDLVISDILMPNMDGIEMIDKIRAIDAHIPVIYTTAFNDNEYLLKTLQQSVTSYMLKPIDMELLLESVQKASVEVENKRLKIFLQEEVKKKTKELQEHNEQLDYQLHTDYLTKLLNRNSLLLHLSQMKQPTLMLIDIDAFKNINDIYGEQVGDLVLCEVAIILEEYINNEECKLYKIGSDEFVIMNEAEFNEENYTEKLNNIIDVISSKSIFIEKYDLSVNVNVTIGVSSCPIDTLGHADMALKKAKEEKIAYKIYNDDIDKEYKNDLKWTKIVNEAIKNDKVVPYFQPIVDVEGNFLKYESLMRIEKGDEVFSPFFFLDVAKKSKQYTKLERMVIQKVVYKIQKEQIRVNLNVSIEDMVSDHFIKFIDSLLKKFNIAKFITFEVLESESIDDYGKVIKFIDMVKSHGSLIAIDDFGSGYSNFAHLLKLHPNYIKIDGSLIKNIDTDENSLIIVETVNDFAHRLGIKTVAEYVHNEEVFNILKNIGIDEYQGYYFGKPEK